MKPFAFFILMAAIMFFAAWVASLLDPDVSMGLSGALLFLGAANACFALA